MVPGQPSGSLHTIQDTSPRESRGGQLFLNGDIFSQRCESVGEHELVQTRRVQPLPLLRAQRSWRGRRRFEKGKRMGVVGLQLGVGVAEAPTHGQTPRKVRTMTRRFPFRCRRESHVCACVAVNFCAAGCTHKTSFPCGSLGDECLSALARSTSMTCVHFVATCRLP